MKKNEFEELLKSNWAEAINIAQKENKFELWEIVVTGPETSAQEAIRIAEKFNFEPLWQVTIRLAKVKEFIFGLNIEDAIDYGKRKNSVHIWNIITQRTDFNEKYLQNKKKGSD